MAVHFFVVALLMTADESPAPQCVEQKPADVTPQGDPKKLYASGLKALQKNDLAKAETKFEQCIRIQRDSLLCHRALAITLAKRKAPDTSRAKACYQRFEQLRPPNFGSGVLPAELEAPEWLNPASRPSPN